MNELVVVGVPLLAIFAGILFQNQRFNGLDACLDRMQADLSQFYQTRGRHDAKIENLTKGSALEIPRITDESKHVNRPRSKARNSGTVTGHDFSRAERHFKMSGL
jgi:hypothetical protein